jgi:hypothetical protein
MLRWIFRKWNVGAMTWSIWLKIGIGDRHLWMRYWTFGFHKMRGISWLAENRLASQERLCSVSAEWRSLEDTGMITLKQMSKIR